MLLPAATLYVNAGQGLLGVTEPFAVLGLECYREEGGVHVCGTLGNSPGLTLIHYRVLLYRPPKSLSQQTSSSTFYLLEQLLPAMHTFGVKVTVSHATVIKGHVPVGCFLICTAVLLGPKTKVRRHTHVLFVFN